MCSISTAPTACLLATIALSEPGNLYLLLYLSFVVPKLQFHLDWSSGVCSISTAPYAISTTCNCFVIPKTLVSLIFFDVSNCFSNELLVHMFPFTYLSRNLCVMTGVPACMSCGLITVLLCAYCAAYEIPRHFSGVTPLELSPTYVKRIHVSKFMIISRYHIGVCSITTAPSVKWSLYNTCVYFSIFTRPCILFDQILALNPLS